MLKSVFINAQAKVIAEAVKAANIDIVGGETMFFDKIIGSITRGKSIDTMFENSNILSSVKEKFIPEKDTDEEITEEIEKDDSNEIDENEKTNKKNKTKKKKTKNKLDLKETENLIKSFIEKYQFLIKGLTSMKIVDALEALIPKMTNQDLKDSLKDLIKKADKIGIADLLVNTLGIK